MRQEQIYEDDVDENGYRGPSKSQLKREQNALQDLGREMTKLGDEQLKRIGLPDEVLVEIVEFRRMRSFGAQRRQLQLIGKKMRNMDPVAVREAIDRVTGESRAAVALLHRCETLRDQMLAGDEAPAGAGHGLNLQDGGHIIVWFGPIYDLELWEQTRDRLYRQGQRSTTSMITLVVEGTVEEDAMRSLAVKDDGQTAMMEAIKARIKKLEDGVA